MKWIMMNEYLIRFKWTDMQEWQEIPIFPTIGAKLQTFSDGPVKLTFNI